MNYIIYQYLKTSDMKTLKILLSIKCWNNRLVYTVQQQETDNT